MCVHNSQSILAFSRAGESRRNSQMFSSLGQKWILKPCSNSRKSVSHVSFLRSNQLVPGPNSLYYFKPGLMNLYQVEYYETSQDGLRMPGIPGSFCRVCWAAACKRSVLELQTCIVLLASSSWAGLIRKGWLFRCLCVCVFPYAHVMPYWLLTFLATQQRCNCSPTISKVEE